MSSGDTGTDEYGRNSHVHTSVLLIVAVLSATWFVLSVYRISFSVALPDVLEVTSVTYTGVSFLFGALFVGYALSQFPAGVVADQVGVKTVLATSALVASAALASVSVAVNYTHVLVALFLIGAGIGSFRSVSQIAISTHVPERFEGRALGVLTAAEPFSYVVGPVTVALLIETYSVYTAPLVLALAPVPFVALIYSRRPLSLSANTSEIDAPSFRQAGTTLRTSLSRTNTLFVLGLGTSFSATTNALVAILPWYLVETTSLSLTHGNLYAGGIFAVGAVAALLGGTFRDRVGAFPILLVGFGTAGVTLALLVSVSAVSHLLATLALFSLGLNTILPARDQVINAHARACSRTHTGAMIGGLRSLCYLGGGLGAVVAGLTFAGFGLTAGFGLLIAYLFSGGLCSAILWKTGGID